MCCCRASRKYRLGDRVDDVGKQSSHSFHLLMLVPDEFSARRIYPIHTTPGDDSAREVVFVRVLLKRAQLDAKYARVDLKFLGSLLIRTQGFGNFWSRCERRAR